jgi:hypothetical protein
MRNPEQFAQMAGDLLGPIFSSASILSFEEQSLSY